MSRTTPSNRGGELLLAAVEEVYGGEQLAAASSLEVHPTMISHLVSGRKRPSLKMAVYLERVIDIPCPAWLEPPAALAA